MKITIEAIPKDIAALVLAVQERQEKETNSDETKSNLVSHPDYVRTT